MDSDLYQFKTFNDYNQQSGKNRKVETDLTSVSSETFAAAKREPAEREKIICSPSPDEMHPPFPSETELFQKIFVSLLRINY